MHCLVDGMLLKIEVNDTAFRNWCSVSFAIMSQGSNVWLFNIIHYRTVLSSFLSSPCLQGASPLDHASSPSVASIQQPRGRNSFVHEHFQAQYR